MMRQNLHVHSVLDDGVSTLEEMADAAAEKGFTSIGFSGHSVLEFANDWCLQEYGEYNRQTDELRKKRGIRIYKGLELDTTSILPSFPLDYVIGSAHYMRTPHGILSVDESREIIIADIDRCYGGDSLAYARSYFRELRNIHDADIVGHFDLVEKFNAGEEIFRRRDYLPWALEVLRELAGRGYIFEINTGAMSQGYTDYPFPRPEIMKELKKLDARITITTDCHDCGRMDYGWEEAVRLARDSGFDEIWMLTDEGFRRAPLYL